MPQFGAENISYFEYRAISELRHAHPELHEGKMRAMIAFGTLVATGNGYDINLLEVVEGLQGVRRHQFTSSSEMPLRGKMSLFFLTPDEFERPSDKNLPGETWSSLELIELVRRAYAILLENPLDYAFDILQSFETGFDSPVSQQKENSSPTPLQTLIHAKEHLQL